VWPGALLSGDEKTRLLTVTLFWHRPMWPDTLRTGNGKMREERYRGKSEEGKGKGEIIVRAVSSLCSGDGCRLLARCWFCLFVGRVFWARSGGRGGGSLALVWRTASRSVVLIPPSVILTVPGAVGVAISMVLRRLRTCQVSALLCEALLWVDMRRHRTVHGRSDVAIHGIMNRTVGRT
jgi:hypothetical protein